VVILAQWHGIPSALSHSGIWIWELYTAFQWGTQTIFSRNGKCVYGASTEETPAIERLPDQYPPGNIFIVNIAPKWGALC
jgi:hypothetical protein